MTDRHLPNLHDYLTVAQAAAVLGVASNTVRAWDAAGKIPSRRNPANGYRLYRRADLEAFLASLDGCVTDADAGDGRGAG
ncbi:MAG TPA: helix-turn-helix domain-containing protein [Thermoanaerobaculia bacterium]|jgi:excisionase family DNA binding protein